MANGNNSLAKWISAAAVALVIEHVLILSDVAIAGRIFGSPALGAMMMILPAFSVVTMVTVIFCSCVAYLRMSALERSDRKRAAWFVRFGFIGSVVIGLTLLGLATLIEYPYLDLMSPGEATLRLFDDYWGWFSLVVLFELLGGIMLGFVYTDGAKSLCVTAYLVHIVVNVLFAVVLGSGKWGFPNMGMEGISLAAVFAYALGAAILVGRFFDHKHCRIEFKYQAPPVAESTEPVRNRYEVLRGSQMTLDDLDGVIELDRMSLDSCYQVSANDDYELFKDNPENGLIIRDRDTGKIVGYSMLLPIRDDMYEKIKTGTFVDTDFKPEMTFRYDHPGIYHLYFASIVVHPEHRSAALVLTMLDAMVQDFIVLAEQRGIWFEDMIADVVSTDGAKFCRLFGLKKIAITNHDSVIYEVKGFPPGVRVTTPATKRLVELYQQKYEAL